MIRSKTFTMHEYSHMASRTAIYPGHNETMDMMGLAYLALGMAGETGEIANKVKKILRDHEGVVPPEKVEELLSESGDVLWYVSEFAKQLNSSLNAVAENNINKLTNRSAKGTIHGDGDDR